MKQNITASEMGRIGGAKKSAAKTRACRENAKKPRKRKKVKDTNQNNVSQQSPSTANKL